MVEVVSDITEMSRLCREKRNNGKIIGLVPTMGALHEGHLSLIRHALEKADYVVVSIYVNPTQFGPEEDLKLYPRDIEGDIHKVDAQGAHAIFAPESEAMYPPGYSTFVTVEGLTEGLCGRSRPHHFKGVTTIVIKLFSIINPHIAVFGQKDAQQLAVIRKMVRDLNMDIEIDAVPTVRESDGLAMSSRNYYLNSEEREQAPVLYKSLMEAKKLVSTGVINAAQIKRKVSEVIEGAALAKIDYIEIVDIHDMTPVDTVSERALLAIAVRFGATRIIDNTIIEGRV